MRKKNLRREENERGGEKAKKCKPNEKNECSLTEANKMTKIRAVNSRTLFTFSFDLEFYIFGFSTMLLN